VKIRSVVLRKVANRQTNKQIDRQTDRQTNGGHYITTVSQRFVFCLDIIRHWRDTLHWAAWKKDQN